MGGCALNCKANSMITSNYGFKDVWIMPNPGDAGSSIGVAQKYNRTRLEFKLAITISWI